MGGNLSFKAEEKALGLSKRERRERIGWMASLFGRGKLRMWGILATGMAWALPLAGHVSPGSEQPKLESALLPVAEANLARGESARAVEAYREAFLAAPDFEARLALIGPLARAMWVHRELADALGDSAFWEKAAEEDWEPLVYRAAMFQFLGDLAMAGRELAKIESDDVPPGLAEAFREQRRVWAEEVGDRETVLTLIRQRAADADAEEEHFEYIRALVETGRDAELLPFLEERPRDWRREANFWRSLLPRVRETGVLDAVAVHLEESWQENLDDPAALFGLAELRLFQGRIDEAVEIFWEVFEIDEGDATLEGVQFFQRLNAYSPSRFPVKHRIDQATGRYGTDRCRDFALFGFSSDVSIEDTSSARDLALLYLKELLLPEETSAVFLQRVREGLDRESRPAAVRILAFAGLGAPRTMLEEVNAFVKSDTRDNAAAEFSLLAINRYVRSVERFPDLRTPMIELARAMKGKFEEGRTEAARSRMEELRIRVLHRLGEADVAKVPAGDRQARLQEMVRAAEEGNPAEAEAIFRELQASGEGDQLRQVLLFLAELRGSSGEPQAAAALILEYLEPLFAGNGGGEFAMPLQWNPGGTFPPGNPYVEAADLTDLNRAYMTAEKWGSRAELMGLLAAKAREEAGANVENGTSGIAGLVTSIFHWWAGSREAAVEAARSSAARSNDPAWKVLVGYLLALQQDYLAAREVLQALSPDTPGAWEASRRLLFALAVAEMDAGEAKVRAEELEEEIVRAEEQLEIAAALLALGQKREAAGWLNRVALDELGAFEEGEYLRLQGRLLKDGGNDEQAAAHARFVLMREVPHSLPRPGNAFRRAALTILAETGHLDEYRGQLREWLLLAPESFEIRLLLGESVEFEARETADWEKAGESYREAVRLRPGDMDLWLDFADWLARHGLHEDAAMEYFAVLQEEVVAVLIDFSNVLPVFRRAGKLSLLVDFFGNWEVPEARSIDDFYGLQPTAHLLGPLGETLLEEGDQETAIQVWEHGLRLNPIGFTESIRLALAQVYHDNGEDEALVDLLKAYVTAPDPDPELSTVHPFVSSVPRWMDMAYAVEYPAEPPVERLISLIVRSNGDHRLRQTAQIWREEMPGRMSAALFSLYLAARSGDEGWRQELVVLRRELAPDDGSEMPGWPIIERVFEDVATRFAETP